MLLEEGIKKVLDRDGVLFLGSGFSTGGTNIKGENMKVGSGLSKAICRDAGMPESDNLAISSQRYIEDPEFKKSLPELIDFLKKEVTCKETTPEQDVIAGLPWKRIYTTNYDDVFEKASVKCGLRRESVTITNKRYEQGRLLSQAIVHINGSINHLNSTTFYDEFKITDENYTRDGLLDSTWKLLFEKDLKSAGVVFFIGYSLSYDQELVRFISNCGISDKCIFIDIDYDDPDKDFKIRRYGTLYKIGVSGFVDKEKEIATTYTPNIGERNKLRGFEKREAEDYFSDELYSARDVLNLLTNGTMEKKFLSSENYCLPRKAIVDSVIGLLDSKDVIVIESGLGNGKTVLLECIAKELVQKNYDVYFVKNLTTMLDDLECIQVISDQNIVLMIDDYGIYTKLIDEIGKSFPKDMKLILTARSAINMNIFRDLTERYHINPDRLKLIDIDTMGDEDITDAISVLDNSFLWGKYAVSTRSEKKKLIEKNYGKQISKLFYLLLDSRTIEDSIKIVIEDINTHNGLLDFILAQSINTICNLKFSYSDIRDFVNITDSQIKSYLTLSADVREVLAISENDCTLKSSIFARYLIKESNMQKEILNMLETIYRECSENDKHAGIYYQQRRNMVSRSNIILLLNAPKDNVTKANEEAILGYFDRIKAYPTAEKNPFFWLQFGITALNLKNYKLADIYFENAYANASTMEGFDTYHIDTHKARLILSRCIDTNTNNIDEALKAFETAHELLMHNGNKGYNTKYVLRQASLYYDYYLLYRPIMSDDQCDAFIKKAFELNNKFVQLFKLLETDGNKLNSDLCRAYRSYHRIFANTVYVLMQRETDLLYNSLVPKKLQVG